MYSHSISVLKVNLNSNEGLFEAEFHCQHWALIQVFLKIICDPNIQRSWQIWRLYPPLIHKSVSVSSQMELELTISRGESYRANWLFPGVKATELINYFQGWKLQS